MSRRGRPPYPDILTPREWEVLDLLRQGLSNPEIAERLGISRDGAKYHVSEILDKLGLSSREEAAAWRPEARRPWWAAAGAPFASVWRKTSASGVAAALSATLFVALLAGLALIAFLLLRGDGESETSPPSLGEFTIPARPEQNVLYVVGEDGTGLRQLVTKDSLWNVQWSAEGDEVAFITSEGGELTLSVIDPSGGEPQVIRRVEDPTSSIDYLWSPQGDIAFLVEGKGELLTAKGARIGAFTATDLVAWSPDGEELLVWSRATESVGGEIVLIDAATQERRALAATETQWPRIAAWSPDGTEVAYLSSAQELVCGSETGQPYSAQALNVLDMATGESREAFGPTCGAGIAGYDWSPDGERLAFTAPGIPGAEEAFERGAYVLDLASGDLRQITSKVIDFDVQWLADGEHLAVKRANCWQCGGSQWWALVSADGREVAEWPGNYPGLGAAPSLARVAVGTATGELLVRSADGSGSRTLLEAAPFQFRDVVWSPEGTRIAFVRWPGSKSNAYAASLAEGRVESLVLPPDAFGAAFSPGLDRVAYVLDGHLVVARADGGAAQAIADNVSGIPHSLQWSPDSERIAFIRVIDFPQGELAVVNADGRGLQVLREFSMGDPMLRYSWSPDGTRLLLFSAKDERILYVMDVATGRETPLVAGVREHVAWSPDGSQVAVVDKDGLSIVTVDSGERRHVLPLPNVLVAAPAWSPDGSTIAVLEVAADGTLWLVGSDGREPRKVASALPRPGRFAGEYTPNLRGYWSAPSLRWSPDGERIAFNFLNDEGHGIFLYDVGTGEVHPLSLSSGPGYLHVVQGWHPDGSRLAIVSSWMGP